MTNFFSEFKKTLPELESYLVFSKIKNTIYENNESMKKESSMMISGRAILGRMEGEFTRLKEMYGNLLIFFMAWTEILDGKIDARFLKPLYTNENLKIKFKISEKTDLNKNYGLLAIDFEGYRDNGELVVVSKRNLYQIKKEL